MVGAMRRNKIENIIIHCSDSEWGSVNEIRKWHIQRGWKDIGYHFVILNGNIDSDAVVDFPPLDGSIEVGRPLNEDSFLDDTEVGAHALGYNHKSVGICLIGKDRFTTKQMSSLEKLLGYMLKIWKLQPSVVLGHYEVDKNKTCPNFNVSKLRQRLSRQRPPERR